MQNIRQLIFAALAIFIVLALFAPQAEAFTFSNTNFFNFPKPTKKPKPSKTPKPTPTPKVSPSPTGSPSVRIIYPNGGEVFTYGDTVKVIWEKNRISSCFLGFSFGPGSLNWINTEITGDITSYDWVINNWNMGDEPVQLKLELDCWSENGQPMDQSDNFFTVKPIPTPTPSATPISSSTSNAASSSDPQYNLPSFLGGASGVWVGNVSMSISKRNN